MPPGAAERIVVAVVEIFQGRRAVLYEVEGAALVCVAAAGVAMPRAGWGGGSRLGWGSRGGRSRTIGS